ncbi:MAG: recombination associated protein RdgC [Kiritimatiellia bacterium]|jgi:recombination associated protein RdgC
MGILSGALTVRRFRIVGNIPEGFRELWRDRLNEQAFKDSPIEVGKEEREGWVQIHNLLDTTFDDFNKWLYNDLVLLALRVDKKSLPGKLFKATLDKEFEKWCVEHEVKRCPKAEKEEIKDRLETAWLKRTLPKVAVTELCFNIQERYVILHSLSESASERVRKRFFQTFGLKLVPWSPLDGIEDEELRDALLDVVPSMVGEVTHD